MLAIVEKYLRALETAHTDTDITKVLAAAAGDFGFRSAYVIEYGDKLSRARRVLDTNPKRRAWWSEYFASDLRPKPSEVAASVEGKPLLHLDASRFGSGSEKIRKTLEAHDIVDVTAVPISHDGTIVGVAGFCGRAELDARQAMALQLLGYNFFSHMRSAQSLGAALPSVALTPREREVIRLSADGLTSAEIAIRLGMSARTANQHVDNVADKLGTRNRAHTVAESVRRGLLD